jgi:AraC family transcriptional activator of tynA and feaB
MLAEPHKIATLSTNDVAPVDRLSYWSSALSSTFTPSAVDTAHPLEFESEIAAVTLGEVSFTAARGSAQRSIRARPELRRTREHCFNLVLVLGGSWQVSAGGARGRFGPGDLIFYDTRDLLSCELLLAWSDVNLQLSEPFVRKWLPNPAWLIGRAISRDSQWGRVLASYVAQLSPQFVVQAPLPQSMLIDQVGALLALTAAELSGGRATSPPVERSLRDKICDHIKQRCLETSLQAADIAAALNISKRTLHRALAACGDTFGALLIQARVELASRMLQSPLFDRVTTAEIGRRAGFSDASHFTKVMRLRTGQRPLQMRRTRHS